MTIESTESTETIITRPYRDEADMQPIVDLINACNAVDRLDAGTSLEELRLEFAHPQFDRARDVCLLETSEGQPVGLGKLWISPPDTGHSEGFLTFYVHPAARGGDLVFRLIAWGETRMREVGEGRGEPVRIMAEAREQERDRRGLLEQQGFQETRYFFRMARSLSEPIPEPQLPAGFTLRTMREEDSLQCWVDMFNESFIDHWNHHPLTAEQLEYYLSDSNYQRQRDLIAVSEDGTFAAFCYCHISAEENQRSGRAEGWIGTLGTRRGYRRLGLGRAMLLAGLRRLQADGMSTALLGVDAQNPNGALKLYEAVGFEQIRKTILYSKEL